MRRFPHLVLPVVLGQRLMREPRALRPAGVSGSAPLAVGVLSASLTPLYFLVIMMRTASKMGYGRTLAVIIQADITLVIDGAGTPHPARSVPFVTDCRQDLRGCLDHRRCPQRCRTHCPDSTNSSLVSSIPQSYGHDAFQAVILPSRVNRCILRSTFSLISAFFMARRSPNARLQDSPGGSPACPRARRILRSSP